MVPFTKLAQLVLLLGASLTSAQKACSLTAENRPGLTWSTCTASGACTEVAGSVTVDANWRWTHSVSGSNNCYSGNTWDASLCPDGDACAANCCVDGADYAGTYGVTSAKDALTLRLKTTGPYSTNIGSRLYLMDSDTQYKMFKLLGNEFTFDVDVSQLGCGLNGALYFVSMDADGGMSKFSGNKAGAKFGTGYCDAQCAKDVKFINGKANVAGWTPSSTDPNSGVGNMGSCCAEMDIWEANSMATAYTPHPCINNDQHVCFGDDCGGTYSNTRYAGDCDPDGCDYNSYRQGNHTFYGPGSGYTLDTTKKVSVVTQFITDSAGDLADIKRFYVQNGKVIPNSESTMAGTSGNSITEGFCDAQKSTTGDLNVFAQKGGIKQMGAALKKGMVLVLSLWDDHAANMLWLDSTYPVTSTAPGAERGSCATTSGDPKDVEANQPNAKVTFSNIKFGPVGSTFNSGSSGGSSSSAAPASSSTAAPSKSSAAVTSSAAPVTSSAAPVTSSSAAPATSSAPSGCTPVTKYGQCGGNGYTGCKVCVAGSTCTYNNDWYSQCI